MYLPPGSKRMAIFVRLTLLESNEGSPEELGLNALKGILMLE